MPHQDGTIHVGKIDLYKQVAFILEAKQSSDKGTKKLGTAKRGTPAGSSRCRTPMARR